MSRNFDLRYEETGEVRPPFAGEWFRGYKGYPVRAMFDYSVQSFPILRVMLIEISAAAEEARP